MRFLLVFFVFCANLCQLWPDTRVDARIHVGQDALYRLNYKEAEAVFKGIISDHPNDPAGHAFLAITYWNELLRAASNLALDEYATPTPFTKGITDKPIDKERERFLQVNQQLIDLCDRNLQENSEDVRALYFKGVAYENLAAEALAIKKSQTQAASYGKKARGLHKDVLERDPSFVDAKLSLGTYEFAVATLPWFYKILLAFVVVRGDKEKGLALIQEVAEKGKYRQLDAQIVLALLHSWKGDPHQSIRILEELSLQYPMNYLLDLNIAAIYEIALKDPASSLRVYKQLAEDLDEKAPGLAPGEVFYRIGRTQYNLRESSMALESFEKAQSLPQGERETDPLCSYYMAKIYQQRGELEKSVERYEEVLAYEGPKESLEEQIEEAEEALRKMSR